MYSILPYFDNSGRDIRLLTVFTLLKHVQHITLFWIRYIKIDVMLITMQDLIGHDSHFGN